MHDGGYVVADCPEVPDVVLEKGMVDDVIDAFVAQSVLSAEQFFKFISLDLVYGALGLFCWQ